MYTLVRSIQTITRPLLAHRLLGPYPASLPKRLISRSTNIVNNGYGNNSFLASSVDIGDRVHDEPHSSFASPPPKGIFRYVVQNEIDAFLKPLYVHQWSIKGHSNLKGTTFSGLFLTKAFKFSGYDATMDFLNDVAQIVREENHHPEISFDYNSVKFSTQTHHVARLKVSGIDGKIHRSPKPPPGITPSDVRLAILIENLFTDIYLVSGKGRMAIQSDPGETPETLKEFKNLQQISPAK